MRPSMKTRLILLAAFSSAAFADCFPVTGDRILGRDLAGVDPRFSTLSPTQTIGFVPAPGVKRIYASAELERIARANGVAPGLSADVCFEIPMQRLTEKDAINAMRRSLPADAELRIIELAKA